MLMFVKLKRGEPGFFYLLFQLHIFNENFKGQCVIRSNKLYAITGKVDCMKYCKIKTFFVLNIRLNIVVLVFGCLINKSIRT